MSPSELVYEPSGSLRGQVSVPGDKSISHRALLLNALARKPARVRNLLWSEDVAATARALGGMGVSLVIDGPHVRIEPPADDLQEPEDVVDCGNSGTSMRLLAGILASQPFHSVLTGDDSLRRRPMLRVVKPLRAMGAKIDGREGGNLAPLGIRGGKLSMTETDLPLASAQVKSAILLAGLRAGTAVREPQRSRDHTERMLERMGAVLRRDPDDWLVLLPVERLDPVDVDVPGDLSAAAFYLVGAAIVPGSEVILPRVGVNPTRTGVLDALQAMGADLLVEPIASDDHEPTAELTIRAGGLHGTRIEGPLALRCLDELPVLAVAAAFAEGETVISDAAELRVKETDRIARVVAGLRSIGVECEERPDGMVIQGGRPTGPGRVDATGDHRIAMSFAVAGLATPGGIAIHGADAVSSSYPDFYEHLRGLL
jgi:3-phosphoshikimate 1-carboxyvinyltransferase